MLCRNVLRLIFLSLSLTVLCFCQSTALLTGSVSDSSAGAVVGAQVKCWNTETDLRMTGLTNAEGLFRFPDLPVGPVAAVCDSIPDRL